MEEILAYIKDTYQPLAVITYGSYADGTYGPHSDFDALAVREAGPAVHDTDFVHGIQLDVFVYPKEHFEANPDWEEILPILHGQVVYDPHGLGAGLMQGVQAYVAALPRKTPAQVQDEIAWCEKMLLRTQRGDPEGMFRLHWLLVDSLEIFCDAAGQFYWGPKKSLRWMQSAYPDAFSRYVRALEDPAALKDWVQYLKEMAGNPETHTS